MHFKNFWRLAATVAMVSIGIGALGLDATIAVAKVKKHHVKTHAKLKPVRHERAEAPAARPVSPPAVIAKLPPPLAALTRSEILSADPERLERLGRHLIVGYHSFSELKTLVEKRAIAGVFITDHNVKGRSAADVRAGIDVLQAIRADQGLPALIIAADQEGGNVSRLSPPLKRQTSLSRTLTTFTDDDARQKAVNDYAMVQAAELKRIGVTLNLAPVVDLKLNPNNRDDGETRLRTRAIAADPYLVAKVAEWYCDAMATSGIMCTLKHFPGLGRVSRDTHVAMGDISASEGQLELNDWVPFRRVMNKANVATMLGHVRVSAIDKDTPASYSMPVIKTLMREQWAYDGLLITDDFSMGAITHSRSGIGGAAIKALNAGADLVLISFLEQHFDTVMTALLDADIDYVLNGETRARSRDRIARITLEASRTPDAR